MKKLVSVALVIMLIFGQVVVFADSEIPNRSEVEDKYKIDLSELYGSREEFEADVKKLKEELIPQLGEYNGKLDNAETLYEYFELDSKVYSVFIKGYRYGKLALDLDQTDSNAQEMVSMAYSVYGQYRQTLAFERPQLLEIPQEKLDEMMNDPILAEYKHYLEELVKEKEHTLSEEEENILSMLSELTSTPNEVFDKVLYADYEYPTIIDDEGNEIKLTNSVYYKILEEGDRELRKKAWEARTESYRKINNTLAATYIGEINKNIFLSKARGYNSSIEASLSGEHIPKSIYDSLVESVNENLEYLHKYNAMKKNATGLEEMHAYDTSLPLVGDYKMEMSYEEAVDMILKGLVPLGEKYVNDFENSIESRWVDVYEGDNKYTGAYSAGVYGVHPFILMNYKNDLDSALTLAHEMGHALNTKYSNEAQNLYNSGYPIFTAEVASTANELLVMDYLIKNASSDKEKLFLLNKQIENIKGTVYTQVMFSEFEKTAHEMSEQGEPLSANALNNLWLELLKKYNGDAYTTDEASKYSWERIPHFYMNFYVYKYATSMSASFKLVNDMIEGEEGAVDRYLEFLAAGGSDYPVEMLKKAGVDMNSSEPVDTLLAYFGNLVEQMEKLLEQEVEVESNTTVYIVQPNDVLWKIAKKYETTAQELSNMNNLENPNMIYVGAELIVPVK